jgi:hypothetical protein
VVVALSDRRSKGGGPEAERTSVLSVHQAEDRNYDSMSPRDPHLTMRGLGQTFQAKQRRFSGGIRHNVPCLANLLHVAC